MTPLGTLFAFVVSWLTDTIMPAHSSVASEKKEEKKNNTNNGCVTGVTGVKGE